MRLVAPDLVADLCGLSPGLIGLAAAVGAGLWLLGWWSHRFWVVLIATVAAIQGLTVPSTIGAGIAMTICLQLGYLGGLFTRFCLAANRAVSARPSGSSLKAAD